jgi:hypothetical protein
MKPTLELSADTQRLIDFLVSRDRATYAEMSSATGRNIEGRDRYVLSSARRVLEKQRGIVFAAERGVGVVRATNTQVATLATIHPINRIRRATSVAQKRQEQVNIQALTADDRLAFDIGRSVISAIRSNTSQSLRTRLREEIERRDGGIVNITSVLALPRHQKRA